MSINTPIHYELYIEATNCNPNGDPQNGGAPRMTEDGFGIISPVCIKRKLRDAAKVIVAAKSEKYDNSSFGIFVDPDAGSTRLETMEKCAAEEAGIEQPKKGKGKDDKGSKLTPTQAWAGTVKKHWDSRVFGNLINMSDSNAIQRGGAVTVNVAKSIEPIIDKLLDMQITASVAHKTKGKGKKDEAAEDAEDSAANESLTGKMGIIHLVSKAVYKVTVATSVANIARNKVTEQDLELLEETIKHMFVADASLGRPVGSLRVAKAYKVEYPSALSLVDVNLTSGKMVGGELVVQLDEAKIAKRKLTITELDCECDD